MPIVFFLYWIIPSRHRWPFLLAASYYFYMSWNIAYVVLIAITTLISYLTALKIEKAESQKIKKFYSLIASIVSIGILFVFKYFNFASYSICQLLRLTSINIHPVLLKLALPVGISFYTFQTLSYVIDVYKGTIQAEKNLGIYATFISFFPQLVAGPIERTSNLLPQIKSEKKFDYEMATQGIILIVIGFFKKLVVADTLAKYVDNVYANVSGYRGFVFVLASVFFAIQIYCDFSGYSDIAIGVALLLGIRLMTNFKSPYLASNIKEFWNRWHISLSTWFRDYVYIPLGGNRVSKIRRDFNYVITFLVSGLWHGANWTYVIWGGIHGLGQVIENRMPKFLTKNAILNFVNTVIKTIFTFVFVTCAWVFFRAKSLKDAILVFENMFLGASNVSEYVRKGIMDIGIVGNIRLFYIFFLICILFLYDIINYNKDIVQVIKGRPLVIRWSIYIVMALITILFSQKGIAAEFVYFQF